eukprot:scaffold23450_cov135-Isochrysis_galbana.AAC.2
MSPPRSYRPPIATRGPRLATRGRKIPGNSLGFRGALWGVLPPLQAGSCHACRSMKGGGDRGLGEIGESEC